MLNEKQKQIFDFIYDQKQRNLTTQEDKQGYKTILFKTKINIFDYIYGFDYVEDVPDIDSEPKYYGVIDTRTNNLYFASYKLKSYFEMWDPYIKTRILENYGNIGQDEIAKQYNELMIKEIEKIAQNTPDDNEQDECNEQTARQEAEQLYYYGERQKDQEQKAHFTSELLKFVENPNKTIKESINKQIENITKTIKYKKLINRLKQEYLKEIETSDKYKYFRLAKEIKNQTPEKAKQVIIKYLLEDGETITGKYNTEYIYCPPYDKEGDQVNFSCFGWDSKTRETIRHKQRNNDLYIKNILSISYSGKTLYEVKPCKWF